LRQNGHVESDEGRTADFYNGAKPRMVAFVISLIVGVLADKISKENKQEWDNSLNYDRYRPGRSGIAVHDAPVYPCR